MIRRLTFAGPLEPAQLARLAHLRYVCDQDPGLSRRKSGGGFIYLSVRGTPLRNPHKIARIEALSIPPAWQDVWICAASVGHLQATGRDARRRKQYIYHERWQEAAALAKFARLAKFGALLPALRRAIAARLACRRLTHERVLAGMIAVLDLTGIRVGNEEYVKENGSYGLSTLRNRHVAVSQRKAELRFRAKGGIKRTAVIDSPAVVRLIRDCAQLPGSHVFQYVDDNEKIRPVHASDVNKYLQELASDSFTAKDFRTWKASAYVAGKLFIRRNEPSTTRRRKRIVREIVDEAASMLSNTPSVCRNYYIHPGLLASYEQGTFGDDVGAMIPRKRKWLSADDQILDRFLKSWKPTIES
jgi:DNA topoisomerase-1